MARSKQFFAALAAASTILPGAQAAYNLVDSFSGSSFFDTMDFFTETDPTNGTVTYVDFETATSDIVAGKPDPSSWTNKPVAVFEGCAFDSHVKELSLVVNIALCGDWAGEVWQSGGCAASTGVATCEQYVQENEKAMESAYWVINKVEMFQEA